MEQNINAQTLIILFDMLKSLHIESFNLNGTVINTSMQHSDIQKLSSEEIKNYSIAAYQHLYTPELPGYYLDEWNLTTTRSIFTMRNYIIFYFFVNKATYKLPTQLIIYESIDDLLEGKPCVNANLNSDYYNFGSKGVEVILHALNNYYYSGNRQSFSIQNLINDIITITDSFNPYIY